MEINLLEKDLAQWESIEKIIEAFNLLYNRILFKLDKYCC